MLTDSLIIIRKELRRIFTDRRMVFMLVVIPLIMLPLMYGIMARVDRGRESDISSYMSRVCLYEGEGNQDVIGRFHDGLSTLNASIETVSQDGIETAMHRITAKDREILIVLPDSMQKKLDDFRSFDVSLFYNSTADYSQHAFDLVSGVLDLISNEIVLDRMENRGIPQDILVAFSVNQDRAAVTYNLAEQGSLTGQIIGMMLPFFMLIYLFTNSMKVGLDTVAGEKERGTLAILLVNQVDRLSIVIGKMVSVMIAAIVGAASSALGLIIASRYFMDMFGDSGAVMSGYSMDYLHILQFAITIIPLAILVSSLILIVSTYARNPKEGQGMIMPIYIVVMIVGISTMQTSDVPPQWMRLTPIFNSLLALKDVFMQDASWSTIGFSVLTNILLSSVMIYMTLRMFKSEKVLFRI